MFYELVDAIAGSRRARKGTCNVGKGIGVVDIIIGNIIDRVGPVVVGVRDEFHIDFVCFGAVVEGVDARVIYGVRMRAVSEFKAKFVGVGVYGCKLHGWKVGCQSVHKKRQYT